MPMSPRLLRPRASAAFPVAVATDDLDNPIAPVDYVQNGIPYRAHVFTSSGTLTFSKGGKVEYLVVAGGGGGGGGQFNAQTGAGGGGAGGLRTGDLNISPGTYPVAVGAGGNGGTATSSSANRGGVGGDSSFGTITSTGGGGGGGSFGNASGGNGGSGGGAGNNYTGGALGGAGTSGQGNNGGNGGNSLGVSGAYAGGGGGGASGAGQSVGVSGGTAGGAGTPSTITGVSVTYAGGGGGGHFGTGGAGGAGGGGAGGGSSNGANGTNNTGGGGGGSGVNANSAQSTGGNGGSGIVVVRYVNSQWTPASFSGLSYWLDAASSTTLTPATAPLANSSAITTWADKSGTGLSMTAPAANRPTYLTSGINGKPALSFASSSMSSTFSRSLTQLSMFFVGTYQAGGAQDRIVGLNVSGGSGDFGGTGAIAPLARTGSIEAVGTLFAGGDRVTRPITYGAPFISHVAHDGATLSHRVNGGATATFSGALNGTYANMMLATIFPGGATAGFAGRMSELLFYDRALTLAESQQVEGYLAWKWGLQEQLPFNHPYASGFPGYGSQATPTDSDAIAYLNAVATADGGHGVEVPVANAINDFIVGCKADGIWSAIKASCILMGARTLSGALTPLVGGAPTNFNNNYVSADYNRKTGLIRKTSAWLDTNRARAVDPQNSSHAAAFSTTTANVNYARIMVASGYNVTGGTEVLSNIPGDGIVTMSHTCQGYTNVSGLSMLNFCGINRSQSSSFDWRINSSSGTIAATSQTPASGNWIFYGNYGLAFYSVGESIDLAALDTRVSALRTAIGAAIP